MTEIVGAMDDVSDRIRKGDVFIYPTDTVYGIGCDATNKASVERVFKIKGRGRKPMSVAFCCIEQMERYVELDGDQKRAIEEKLPGAYTFIVKNKKMPKEVTTGLDTIGVRIPDYEPIIESIKKAGVPIVTTSANPSGEKPADSLDEIPEGLLEKVDFAIDGGECGSGKPSTVVDLLTGETLR